MDFCYNATLEQHIFLVILTLMTTSSLEQLLLEHSIQHFKNHLMEKNPISFKGPFDSKLMSHAMPCHTFTTSANYLHAMLMCLNNTWFTSHITLGVYFQMKENHLRISLILSLFLLSYKPTLKLNLYSLKQPTYHLSNIRWPMHISWVSLEW